MKVYNISTVNNYTYSTNFKSKQSDLLNFLKHAITNTQSSPQRKSYFGNFAFSKIFPIQFSKRDGYFMLQF